MTGKTNPPAVKPATKARARLDALIEEATVDAYSKSEQAVGLYTMICERLALPFKANVFGRETEVIAIEMGEDDLLRAVCRVGRTRRRISLAAMAVPAKRPAGAEWIVAYRRWCGLNGAD